MQSIECRDGKEREEGKNIADNLHLHHSIVIEELIYQQQKVEKWQIHKAADTSEKHPGHQQRGYDQKVYMILFLFRVIVIPKQVVERA